MSIEIIVQGILMLTFPLSLIFNRLKTGALRGVIGNPVKAGSGPAAVTGDEASKSHCILKGCGKAGAKDDPEARRPACREQIPSWKRGGRA
jgi:hypothetical protein